MLTLEYEMPICIPDDFFLGGGVLGEHQDYHWGLSVQWRSGKFLLRRVPGVMEVPKVPSSRAVGMRISHGRHENRGTEGAMG